MVSGVLSGNEDVGAVIIYTRSSGSDKWYNECCIEPTLMPRLHATDNGQAEIPLVSRLSC
jgi:hypothetical protein